nr:hypothetical protein [Halomonas sp.]
MASLVAQAKDRAAKDNIVVNVSSLDALQAKIERFQDSKTGADRLRLIHPMARKGATIYDLTFFLAQEELGLIFAEGFRRRCTNAGSEGSMRTELAQLRSGIGAYLTNLTKNSIIPECIDEAFWASFKAWLDAPRANGEPLKPSSRSGRLLAIPRTLEILRSDIQFGHVASYLLDRSGFPKNAYPGVDRRKQVTPTLSPSERREVLEACQAEILKIRERFFFNKALLEQGYRNLQEARAKYEEPDYADFAVCAAWAEEHFKGRPITSAEIISFGGQLRKQIYEFHGGISAIKAVLYPDFQDLVPFVLLIAFKTAFNAELVLTMNWSDIRETQDGRGIVFSRYKPRAGRIQDSSHDVEGNAVEMLIPSGAGAEHLGLKALLDLLKEITSYGRSMIEDPEYKDRLFVASSVRGGKITSYGTVQSSSNDSKWNHRFEAFREKHKLVPFTLRGIRQTEGEMAYRRRFSSDDRKERLGHKNPRTSWTHYNSDYVRRHSQERIGQTQELYGRFVATDGQIDPRKPGPDKVACTPGFLCLDPYAGEASGQKTGNLCAAYGQCPSCPLAVAKPKDAQCLAYYSALRDAIYQAQQGHMTSEAWIEKWSPILEDLNALISLAPDDVLAQARRFRTPIQLQSIG